MRDSTRARRSGRGRGTSGTLWYLDPTGKLAALPVRVGLTDGQRTSVAGPGVEIGVRVIVGLAEPGAAASTGATSTNPLQPTMGPRGPGRF